MQKLVILKGLPASGKSTYAKKWVEICPTTRVRVSRDDIRRQLGPYWVPQREKLVTKIERLMVYESLNCGYNVIIDATNLNKKYFDWQNLLEEWSRDIHFPETKLIINESFLDVSVEECIRRDLLRPVEERVGEEVINRMAKNIEKGVVVESQNLNA